MSTTELLAGLQAIEREAKAMAVAPTLSPADSARRQIAQPTLRLARQEAERINGAVWACDASREAVDAVLSRIEKDIDRGNRSVTVWTEKSVMRELLNCSRPWRNAHEVKGHCERLIGDWMQEAWATPEMEEALQARGEELADFCLEGAHWERVDVENDLRQIALRFKHVRAPQNGPPKERLRLEKMLLSSAFSQEEVDQCWQWWRDNAVTEAAAETLLARCQERLDTHQKNIADAHRRKAAYAERYNIQNGLT